MPDVAHFAAIESEFIARVHHVVWCNMATVDAQGRPRSRIVHPLWEGPTGWLATHRLPRHSSATIPPPSSSPPITPISASSA